MRFRKLLIPLTILSFLALLQWSCREPDIIGGNGVEIFFSTDTLRFDTVFTDKGSITLPLKVYNRSSDAVNIDRVSLQNTNSFFRMNVDGLPGDVVEDVIIWPEDSIYVFVEVTIDPDQPAEISPYVIQELLEFYTGDVVRTVLLEAWGQNANYIPSSGGRNSVALLSCDFNRIDWDDPRPYVIYGVLLVDSCTLQIPAGARIYFHGSIANNQIGIYQEGILLFLENGKIEVNGTPDDPVTFASDRIEPSFSEVPGQWPGLRFGTGSNGNMITHAIVEHAEVGIRVDSAAQVSLNSVEVRHCNGQGIVGIHATIQADNCLVHNTGGPSLQMAYGGNLTARYCSFASYGNTSEALTMNNFFCYDPPICSVVGINPINASLTNCILNGNERDEISLLDVTDEPGDFNYIFRDCLVRVDDLLDEDNVPDFFDRCIGCISLDFGDPVYLDVNMDDYRLDTMSLGRDVATPIPGISSDILGAPRDPVTPDVGCYELVD